MAEIKITELPQAVSLGELEQFALVQEGVTKRATIGLVIDAVIEAITGPGNPFIQSLTLEGNLLGITQGNTVTLTALNMTGDGYNAAGELENNTVQFWLENYGNRIVALENASLTNDYLPVSKSIVQNGPDYIDPIDSISASGLFAQAAGTADAPWGTGMGGMILAGSSESGNVIPKIGVGYGTAIAGEDDDNIWWQSRTGRIWYRGVSRSYLNEYGIATNILASNAVAFNSVEDGGVFRGIADDPNRPPEMPPNSAIPFLNMGYQFATTDGVTQIASRATGNNSRYYIGYRGLDTNGDWSQWTPVWDNKNLMSPYGVSAQRKYMPQDVSKNGIWNQWIEPLSVIDEEGNLWFGSVGANRELYITKKILGGAIVRKKIGNIQGISAGDASDDHNAPAILLDRRPGASFPIIIFQCDHNTTPVRYWRFNTLDINAWDVSSWNTIGSENVGYVQAFRYNDEIFVWSRISPGAGGTLRPWRVAYSPDNGVTWTTRRIFEASVNWLYCLGRLKFNQQGINFAFNGHPRNTTNQGVYFLEIDFVSGAVVNPADRANPVIPDLRAAIANPSFVPVDPFVQGLQLRGTVGTEITRLFDVTGANTGTCRALITVSPSQDATMQNFSDSYYRLISFNLADGSTISSNSIFEAGMPIENNPRGQNFYFAGGCMRGSNNAILAVWRNESMLNGGDDITYDYGTTILYNIDVTTGNDGAITEIIESDRKLIRPQRPWPLATGIDIILYSECEHFYDYNDFYGDIIIHDFNDNSIQSLVPSQFELLANKATDFSVINNTLYPTVQAVQNWVNSFGIGDQIEGDEIVPLNDAESGGLFRFGASDPDKPPEFEPLVGGTYVNIVVESSPINAILQLAMTYENDSGFSYIGYRGRDSNGNYSSWSRLSERDWSKNQLLGFDPAVNNRQASLTGTSMNSIMNNSVIRYNANTPEAPTTGAGIALSLFHVSPTDTISGVQLAFETGVDDGYWIRRTEGEVYQPYYRLATRQFVLANAGSYRQHAPVSAATIGNITLSGLQTIDGIALTGGERILVKNQTLAQDNGIYVAATGAWARATDFDQAAAGEIEQGAAVFVEQGTVNNKTSWTLNTGGTITVGTTPLEFIQYAGPNVYEAGAGLDLTGNTFSALLNDPIWNAGSLQSIPVSAAVPTSGQILTYDGSAWGPADPAGGGVAQTLSYNNDSVLAITSGNNVILQRIRPASMNAGETLSATGLDAFRPFVWGSAQTGWPSTSGMGFQIERRTSDTSRTGFRIFKRATGAESELLYQEKLAGDLITWGPQQTIMNTTGPQAVTGTKTFSNIRYSSQAMGGSTVINFDTENLKSKTISADTAFTFFNQTNNAWCNVKITNNDTAMHVVTFEDAAMASGANGIIPAGAYAIFSFLVMDGIVNCVQSTFS